MGALLAEFRTELPFELDPFQISACESLESGRSVLVAAPTGSGKTVVGEFALHMALARGNRAFYTTPIKALSNQKYRDLVSRYGPAKIGLLTGDTVINGDAPIVVMTTEVVRNMLYDGSNAIVGLSHVVMDEVHYLADRERGAVWEEVILHLPESVSIAALSATVSNAEEFGAWLAEVRGDTDIVVEERRPVPLHQHVLVGRRLLDLFAESEDSEQSSSRVNPELIKYWSEQSRWDRGSRGNYRDRGRARGASRGGSGSRGASRNRGGQRVRRADMLERLKRANLLPALVFVFSRAGCNAAVEQCMIDGVRLTTDIERREIRDVVETRCADLPAEDRSVLGYYEWFGGLERGLAAHHAGMLPLFKETVEELFTRGLVKAVFATETLALGINMPARTVVLERMVKYNGQTHAEITAGEYTQFTGRAGRRGIDTEGHAVVVWSDELEPQALAGLASTRTFPLRSSFRPSYNMAVNLVERLGRPAAREVLETSFAQFQADAGVVGLASQVRKHEHTMAGYAESMTCHLGDFAEYADIRRQISDTEKAHTREGANRRKAAAAEQLGELAIGDIIVVTAGRRTAPALVVDIAGSADEPRPAVLTIDRRVRKLSVVDVPHGVTPISTLTVPRGFDARSANWRRDLARALADHTNGMTMPRARREASGPLDADEELIRLRSAMRAHPCHGCSDREQHARWAARYHKLESETQALRRRVETRTNTVARQFDRVCALLAELGYLDVTNDKTRVTDTGRMLARLYTDQDLLTAECLKSGIWHGLDIAEFAAACSALVFESRLPEDSDETPALPPGQLLRGALAEQERIAGALMQTES